MDIGEPLEIVEVDEPAVPYKGDEVRPEETTEPETVPAEPRRERETVPS